MEQSESTTSSSLSGSFHSVNPSFSSSISSATLPTAPKIVENKNKIHNILETSKVAVPAEKKTNILPKTKVICPLVDKSAPSNNLNMGKPSSLAAKTARVRTDGLVPLKTLFMQSMPSSLPATKPDPVNKVTFLFKASSISY
jgi:hypothetical protein